MWDAILERLERKARQGVDVRLLYDDIGCVFTLPRRFPQQMQERGIKCGVVNPFRPVVSIRLNNRDHRKICVIDGHTGFTGGYNLADEYINAQERFGHWKDTGIMLRGPAVWNLTVMFLSTWDYTHGIRENMSLYRPQRWLKEQISCPGVIQPYDDSPVDSEAVGANVYLNLISRATKSIYITTPYLVLDYSMNEALTVAAKSGIDVRIITPHIPDKKSVFEVTRANYHALMEAGVKIYEYTPGFIHAKTFLVDGDYGVVGTINLDYRSLYLHFECGVWVYRHPVIEAITDDFLRTQQESRQILPDETNRLSWMKRLCRAVLQLVAPLM
jgi:cardiolipin synthase